MKVLMIPRAESNPYQKCLVNPLRKFDVDVVRDIGFTPIFFTLSLLKNLILNWKLDILHVHWLHPFITGSFRPITIFKSAIFIAIIFIIRLLGIKIVWTVHNLVGHESNFKSFEIYISKIFCSFCNKIIVHSKSAKTEFINLYRVSESLVSIISHGNYINCYSNNIDQKSARNKLNIEQDKIIFLYFGRIRLYKGLHELIDNFTKIQHDGVKLLLAGEPRTRKIARDILQKSVTDKRIIPVLSYISDEEIQFYMNACDAVVLPYRDVLTSGALILAMSFGKAVIAPSLGCIQDTLDNKGGFLYDPSDPEGLRMALENAMKANLKQMGRYNFEEAKKMDWDEIARETYLLYKECIGR